MNNKWTYKKIGEIGTLLRGKGIQKTDFIENGQPCIHYGQIHTAFDVSTDRHLSSISSDLYNKSVIASTGDILLTLTSEDVEGSCKSTAWLGNYDVAVSSDAAIFKHSLNPKFFVYYTRSNRFFAEKSKYARGFKVTHIKTSDIAEIPIPVPSLEEQNRIVSELENIDNLLILKKKQLKELELLSESIFYDMFGDPIENEKKWEVKKLGDVCDVRDGTHDSPQYLLESEYFLITSKNIQGDFIDYTNVNYISKEDYDKINKRSYVDEGDIIMGMIGTIGKPIIVHKNNLKFCVKNVALIKFPDSCSVKNVYLKTLLDNTSYKQYILSLNKGGTQKFVALGTLRSLKCPLPPLSLQHEFVKRVEVIEHQKAQISSTIKDLHILFASRMQYWFD
jgi:type I restriction enzyme S subunit